MTQDSFRLQILTPAENCFSGLCVSVRLQTDDGEIEILPGHTNLVSSITHALTRVTLEDGSEKLFAMRLGLVFVNNLTEEVTINVFECDFIENIEHESLLEYHKDILEQLQKGDLTPMQVRFLENQSESLAEMVEIHSK